MTAGNLFTAPLDWTNESLQKLHSALADAYGTEEIARDAASTAGLVQVGFPADTADSRTRWRALCDHLANRGLLRQLVINAAGDDRVRAFHAIFYAALTVPSSPGFRDSLFTQLPNQPDGFVGRVAEIEELHDSLQPGDVTILAGPGGTGKTALAIAAVSALPPERFPDGVLFYTFYGKAQIALCYEHIVHNLQPGVKDSSRESAARLLATKRMLLILDAAEEVRELPELLEIRGSCAVLVTTREESSRAGLRRPGFRRLELHPLLETDAVALLSNYLPAGADKGSLLELADKLARMPLALHIAGAHLAETGQPVHTYAQWLGEQPAKQSKKGERPAPDYERLIERSLSQLEKSPAELLALFGQLAQAPVSAALLADALEWQQERVLVACDELVRFNLLCWEGRRPQTVHALIHTYALRRMPVDADHFARLVSWYHRFFQEQTARGPAGFPSLSEESDHLLRLQANALDREEYGAADTLAWAADEYFDLSVQPNKDILLLQTAIAAARAAGDPQHFGAHVEQLGLAYAVLGRHEEAITHFLQALVISQELGDEREQGRNEGNLGQAYADLGLYQEAIDHTLRALAFARKLDERRDEGIYQGRLGLANTALGRYDEAIAQHQRALAIAREMGDRPREAADLGNLGNAYHSLGWYEEGIEYYRQALTIVRDIGDRRGEGAELGNLGSAFANLGLYEEAIEYHQQALAIAREVGDRRSEGSWLGNLGLAHYGLGRNEESISHFQNALAIAREVGDRRGEGNRLGGLGSAYASMGRYQEAVAHYQEALSIARELGDRRSEDSWLGSLGITYEKQGRHDQAIIQHRQALTIAREIGDRRGQGIHLHNLGQTYANLGRYEEAIAYYEQCQALFKQIVPANHPFLTQTTTFLLEARAALAGE